jgi:hypothetical protein
MKCKKRSGFWCYDIREGFLFLYLVVFDVFSVRSQYPFCSLVIYVI